MLFDTHLTEEFDALRDTVKRMCDAELAPRAAAIDEKNEFPAIDLDDAAFVYGGKFVAEVQAAAGD